MAKSPKTAKSNPKKTVPKKKTAKARKTAVTTLADAPIDESAQWMKYAARILPETAIHEAGHAVVSLLVDRRFLGVTVDPEGEYFGGIFRNMFDLRENEVAVVIARKACRRSWLRPAARALIHDELVARLAGYAAQGILRPSDENPAELDELVDLYDLESDANDWPKARDLASLAALALRTEGDQKEGKYYERIDENAGGRMCKLAWEKLLKFFSTQWGAAATQAVADELLEKKDLSWDEVVGILDQVAGDREEAWQILQRYPTNTEP